MIGMLCVSDQRAKFWWDAFEEPASITTCFFFLTNPYPLHHGFMENPVRSFESTQLEKEETNGDIPSATGYAVASTSSAIDHAVSRRP